MQADSLTWHDEHDCPCRVHACSSMTVEWPARYLNIFVSLELCATLPLRVKGKTMFVLKMHATRRGCSCKIPLHINAVSWTVPWHQKSPLFVLSTIRAEFEQFQPFVYQ